ncbi:MAG: enoyl-CoA hydratase-related protein [Novosphingobium sp.]|nr:enoyl-CoA hydratase-related protein [Novosphingobium sp.]
MSQSEPTVLIERRDTLALITLNRPERRNAVTVEMCEAIYDAACEVAASDARVVILRGAGQDFCVGADIGGSTDDAPPPGLEELGSIHHAATMLHTMPQVSIAAIDGGCAGAGMGYAAACDFRFATPEARFATAFLNVGVSGDMGLAWSLTRILGGAKARELLFFPDKFDGAEAEEIGLVTRLFAREALHEEVEALARQLCAREPLALKMMKANCLSAEQLDIREFVDIETARHLHGTNRPDMGERMAEAYRRSKGS